MKTIKRLTLCSLFALCSLCASAYDFSAVNKDGVYIYYNIVSEEELTCEVTNRNYDRNTYTGGVVIPETTTYKSKTYSVVAIGNSAFYRGTSLTEITIPNSVTSIGERAFSDCISLTEIINPNSLKIIGNGAFEYCKSLTEINIPDSVTTIGESAFRDCASLTEITIPISVTSIGSLAFSNCTSLTEITIPISVTSIENSLFSGCTSLTEVTLPSYLTNLGSNVFFNCTNLSSLTSLCKISPSCNSNTFNGAPTSTCTLYVPLGSANYYSVATGWKDFYKIEEIDTSGIVGVSVDDAEAIGYYTTDGKAVDAPQRGINIMRYSDGTARKVLVK